MLITLYLLGVCSLIFGLVPIVLTYKFRRYVQTKLEQQQIGYTPFASVLVPCKGTDLEFHENIVSIVQQDYPDFEIIFITATEGDPAYAELQKIRSACHDVEIKLIVAGVHDGRAQKLNNLIFAYDHIRPETEIVVHFDADIRLDRNFLRSLVLPLKDKAVGATSGFPWYMPRDGKIGSILRSIWGGGALPLLIDSKHNFASGAANAIRRESLEDAKIIEAMEGAVSDTFAITQSIKSLGQLVEFVPQCLFASPDNSSTLETLRWTNRQTTISRVYSPTFWWTVTLTYSFANALLIIGLGTLVYSLSSGSHAFLAPSLLILGLIPLEIVNAYVLLGIVMILLPEYTQRLRAMRWKYYLLTPVTSLLILINSIVSISTNVIEWRGIKYRLVSPTQTEVIEGDSE